MSTHNFVDLHDHTLRKSAIRSYAGEEMLIVLVPALFMGAYKYYILCIAAILFLLVILAISYSQTIDAYPNGGGAYGVATENLGKIPGLIAGAALIIGYILTVAASSAAATAAIYSAFPVLQPYRVFIALGIIVMVLQTIGSAAILSSLNSGIKDFVLIGNLTMQRGVPHVRETLWRTLPYPQVCGVLYRYRGSVEL